MSRVGHQREYNIVVLGSGGVGKICITTQFVQGVFVERYDPTIEDSYRKAIDVDGRHVMLEIMDTAGTEQFTAMRDMYMRLGQGFLLVFSITSLSSLQDLVELRTQIVNAKGGDTSFPMVLVGNKSDLEEDRQVSRSRAFQLSQSWNNMPYYETSARRDANVTEVFVDVSRQIIRRDMARSHRDDDRDRYRVSRRRRRDRRKRDEYDNYRSGSRCTIL